ncbi:hypothetical protein GJ744_006230 [Endocarpon pusillum]|uniref:Uncharacterized protein n=1 Tax=Endocarpon pusillum TaxID=364733 RepID=A0A8H7AK86_9EURO|nr:hypothetical protein GJ744_006230 [Endocarpon pusillum]
MPSKSPLPAPSLDNKSYQFLSYRVLRWLTAVTTGSESFFVESAGPVLVGGVLADDVLVDCIELLFSSSNSPRSDLNSQSQKAGVVSIRLPSKYHAPLTLTSRCHAAEHPQGPVDLRHRFTFNQMQARRSHTPFDIGETQAARHAHGNQEICHRIRSHYEIAGPLGREEEGEHQQNRALHNSSEECLQRITSSSGKVSQYDQWPPPDGRIVTSESGEEEGEQICRNPFQPREEESREL